MRGFTLWQPMAWAIAEGHKPVENRVWRLPKQFIGQRFAVHAGKKYDPEWAEMIHDTFGLAVPAKSVIALGAVIAVATFTACIDEAALEALRSSDMASFDLREDQLTALQDWFSGPYGFVVADVRKLREPVPCRGFQGLWELPPDVEKDVLARIPPGHSVADMVAKGAVEMQLEQTAPSFAANERTPSPEPESRKPPPAQLTLLDPDDDIPY